VTHFLEPRHKSQITNLNTSFYFPFHLSCTCVPQKKERKSLLYREVVVAAGGTCRSSRCPVEPPPRGTCSSGRRQPPPPPRHRLTPRRIQLSQSPPRAQLGTSSSGRRRRPSRHLHLRSELPTSARRPITPALAPTVACRPRGLQGVALSAQRTTASGEGIHSRPGGRSSLGREALAFLVQRAGSACQSIRPKPPAPASRPVLRTYCSVLSLISQRCSSKPTGRSLFLSGSATKQQHSVAGAAPFLFWGFIPDEKIGVNRLNPMFLLFSKIRLEFPFRSN
jgi:hypothetical protein